MPINIPSESGPNIVLTTPEDQAATPPQGQGPQIDPARDRQYLLNLPTSDLAALAQKGYISPEAAQEIETAKMAFGSTPALDAAGQAVGETAQQMLPQTPFPNQVPPQAPAPVLPEQTMQAAQQEKAHEIAAQTGVQNAVEQGQLRQQADQLAQQEKAAARTLEVEKQVAADQEPHKEKWGLSLRQALAIMLGAVSQGLTGAKINPAIAVMDKMIEREAASKKYDAEQKMALRKQLLEEALYKLQVKKEQTDSALGKANIDKIHVQLGQDLAGVQAQQQFEGRVKSGEGFGAAELATMDPNMANRMVQVKNGVYMPTASKDPDKLRENLNTFDNATRDAKELRKMAIQFGNNSFAKITDREARGRSEALLQGLVGALRLPYFGPGVLTDTEQSLARNMIGNPTNVFSLASANEARINTIIQKLNFAKKTALRNEGVNVPLSANEKKMAAYKAHGVKLNDPELINAMIQKGDWNPDEE